MNTKETSKCRKRLLDQSMLMSSLLGDVIESKPMTKGTVCDLKRKCGKKNCKCAHGEPHSTKVLSSNHHGRTRLLCLTKYPVLQLFNIEKQVKSYQQFRRRRSKVVYCFKSIISEMNKLEKNLLVEVTPKGETDVKRKWKKGRREN